MENTTTKIDLAAMTAADRAAKEAAAEAAAVSYVEQELLPKLVEIAENGGYTYSGTIPEKLDPSRVVNALLERAACFVKMYARNSIGVNW